MKREYGATSHEPESAGVEEPNAFGMLGGRLNFRKHNLQSVPE